MFWPRATSLLAADGKIQTETLLFNVGAAGAKRFNSPRSAARRGKPRQQRDHAPGQRRARTSAASSTWKASRAGNTNSSAAPKMTTASCRLPRCCAPRKIKFIARASTIPRNWRTAFPPRAEDLFTYQGLIIGSVEAGYFTPAQQDLIRAVRRSPRRRRCCCSAAALRSPMAAGAVPTWRICFRWCCPAGKNTFHRDPATVELTPAGADSIICRLGRRSGAKRRALEEAALPDGLPGSRARPSPAQPCSRK